MSERDDKPMRDVDERLADHVDGRLSARERERFDAELRVNPQLRQDLADYERTVASLRQALTAPTQKVSLADRVVAAVVAEEAALAQPAVRRGGFRFGWWSLASAAALLALALMIDRWSPTPTAELTAKQDTAAAPAAPDVRDVPLQRLAAAAAGSDGAGRDGAAEQAQAPAGGSPGASQPDATASGVAQPGAVQFPLTEPPAGEAAGTKKPSGGLFGSRGRAVDTPEPSASASASAPEVPAVDPDRAAPPAGAARREAGAAPPAAVTVVLPGAEANGRSATADAPGAGRPTGSPSTAGPAGPVRGASGSGEAGQAAPVPSAANNTPAGSNTLAGSNTPAGSNTAAGAERTGPLEEDATPVAGGAATVPVAPAAPRLDPAAPRLDPGAPRLAAPPQLVTLLVIEGPVGPVATAEANKIELGSLPHVGALRDSKDKVPVPTQQADLIDRIDRFLGAAVAVEGRPTARLVLPTPSGELVLSPLVSPPLDIAAKEQGSAKPEGQSGGRAGGGGPAVIAETQWLVEGGKADLDVLLARVGLFTQVTQRTRQLGEMELPARPSGPAAPGQAPAGQAPAASDQRRLVLRFRLLSR